VTLGACPGATLFVGGFAIERSAYCAPLDVYFGDSTEPERIMLPFGGVDCRDGTILLAKPDPGPAPDVTGMTLRLARLAIRMTHLIPAVDSGDPFEPGAIVWRQEPNDGATYEPGTVVGLGTCQAADHVVATYEDWMGPEGVAFSDAWMVPFLKDRVPRAFYYFFVSARVIGGPGDGRIATWLLPPWAQQDNGFNTPHVSLVVNDVAQELGFGDHRFDAADYGAEDWRDLEGAIGSQQCVEASTA